MVFTRRRTRQMTVTKTESSGGEASQNQHQFIAQSVPETTIEPTQILPVVKEEDVMNIAAFCPNLPFADRIGGCLVDLKRQLERIASRSEAGSGELRAIGAVIDAANVSMRQSVQENINGIKQLMAEFRGNQLSIRENVNRTRLDMKSQNTHMLIEVRAMIEESEKRRLRDLDRISDSIASIRDEFRNLLYAFGSRENEPLILNQPRSKRQLQQESVPVAKKSKQAESGGEPLYNSTIIIQPGPSNNREISKSLNANVSSTLSSKPISPAP